MIGIIVCTHSSLAKGLKDACEMIAGKQEMLEAIGFDGEEDLVSLSEKLKVFSNQYHKGCIFVCDIINGTPFNACAFTIANTDNVILSGANLPMLIELVIKRNEDLSCDEIADYIIKSSTSYIEKRISKDIFG